ncbi:putative F420-dependent oxidoreductase [Cryptosporangium arvum DSM 44712]|uniref:Putative F420-dependent oxidoreductase n=1 Tax=Cryptosporangium arvum DSM 44712 TaxID=927661 RepID=A0A011ALV7_9ACTN|nr:LLM class F420-dependent oxidoreductase [Cryptosporangium arvum]EXG82931.1 putative F420-dependent oxidoreductase [Cryptosporangium arvum DSM 44712]
MIELGLHIADFTWDSGPAQLRRALAEHVREAEAAGVTRITVMDHFWQIQGVGPAEHEMLEAYTTLGFLAAHTEKARLSTLVTGVIYREPALLAKQISTLDVLTGGRAGLGIGAAWNEDESRGLGFAFPSVTERFERLEEALRICLQMWSDSEEPFDGKWYQLGRTLNSPQNLQSRPPIMIGGGGEKRTLRLVAQYADQCNIAGDAETVTHKLDVLRRHCDDVGRDYDTIEKTTIFGIDPTTTADDIVRDASAMRDLGFTAAYGYAHDVTDRKSIVDLFATAVPKLS